jgi:radical SAM protein with 4Fe4S-binding SPASM domain
VAGLSPERFNELWLSRYREAVSYGIAVGVISLPNHASFKIGARRFYSYYTEEVGLPCFQVNAPFPGTSADPSKPRLPLDTEAYSTFSRELIDVWMEQGYSRGVRLSPYAAILEYFLTGDKSEFPCVWRHDCSREFVSIGPDGSVAQCDCWVASYPEFHFGNVLESGTLAQTMNSTVRKLYRDRPEKLMENGDCIECEYLSICHGGCAIRAFSTYGDLFVKDPYCEVYQAIFSHLKEVAARCSRERSRQASRIPNSAEA